MYEGGGRIFYLVFQLTLILNFQFSVGTLLFGIHVWFTPSSQLTLWNCSSFSISYLHSKLDAFASLKKYKEIFLLIHLHNVARAVINFRLLHWTNSFEIWPYMWIENVKKKKSCTDSCSWHLRLENLILITSFIREQSNPTAKIPDESRRPWCIISV